MSEETTTINIKGHSVLLDADFAADINPALWGCTYTGKTYFIIRFQHKGVSHLARLHRIIVNAPRGMCVDHINGNTLDNRRSNLRICTRHENTMNQRVRKNNTSGKKGVRFIKGQAQWSARISVKGKRLHLGYFASAEEAGAAYDQAALIHYGPFAHLNAGGASRHSTDINVPNLKGVM